jgi:hypothetical protein
MSKVTTETPDADDKGTTISRLADTQKSDAHVSQLLHIAEQCSKMLWTREETGETVTVDPVLTEESRKTLQLAHTRLRDLIDEQRRWSLDPTANEQESSKLIDSTLALYGEKLANTKIYNRPSTFLRPKIGHFTVGWIVWVGGEAPTERDLHAVGASPALAYENFDKCYYQLQEATEKQTVSKPAQKRAPRQKKN